MNQLVVLLGGNIGDKISNFKKAICFLQDEVGEVVAKSSLYESEPWGYEDNYQYLNAVVVINTIYSANECLHKLLKIEVKLGRTRKQTKTYEARTIDLDILFFNNEIINNKELTVPHPLLYKRNFTLHPLFELMPTFHHPVLNRTITCLYNESEDNALVTKLNVDY